MAVKNKVGGPKLISKVAQKVQDYHIPQQVEYNLRISRRDLWISALVSVEEHETSRFDR